MLCQANSKIHKRNDNVRHVKLLKHMDHLHSNDTTRQRQYKHLKLLQTSQILWHTFMSFVQMNKIR